MNKDNEAMNFNAGRTFGKESIRRWTMNDQPFFGATADAWLFQPRRRRTRAIGTHRRPLRSRDHHDQDAIDALWNLSNGRLFENHSRHGKAPNDDGRTRRPSSL